MTWQERRAKDLRIIFAILVVCTGIAALLWC